MPNIRQIITAHNKSVLQTKDIQDQLKQCNCKKNPCPLNSRCFTTAAVYQKEEMYVGLTEGTFKSRYSNSNHTCDFRKEHKWNSTTLSQRQYIWTLKNNKIEYSIKWKIMAKSTAYSTSTKRCNLCLSKKKKILHHMQSILGNLEQ